MGGPAGRSPRLVVDLETIRRAAGAPRRSGAGRRGPRERRRWGVRRGEAPRSRYLKTTPTAPVQYPELGWSERRRVLVPAQAAVVAQIEPHAGVIGDEPDRPPADVVAEKILVERKHVRRWCVCVACIRPSPPDTKGRKPVLIPAQRRSQDDVAHQRVDAAAGDRRRRFPPRRSAGPAGRSPRRRAVPCRSA